MPEEEHRRSPPAWWLSVWQRRWWIALATLFILVWWLVPPWLYRHTGTANDAKLKAITDTRTALFAGLIGVGALLTFWLNGRVYRITTRTLELTEQGHITERYTKAIEQLGSDKLDVRLGGIYALERLAIDSERDHPTVVEVLSAFVREHSDPTHTDSKPAVADRLPAVLQGDEPADGPRSHVEDTNKATRSRPATDVQAAVTVLGRLPRRPYVSRGDLTGAALAGVELFHADLSGIRLSGANLSGAVLSGSNLVGAQLDRTNLVDARLEGANLSPARLYGANLSGARLYEADLSHAGLQEANLSGAVLIDAKLSGAMLERADLSGAMLAMANLTGAELHGANLSGALLVGADFYLRQARPGGPGPRPLEGADAVGLTQEQLDSAHGDAETRLPEGLRRPDGWAADQDSATASSLSQRAQKEP